MATINDIRNGVINQLEQKNPSIPVYGEIPSEGITKPYFYVATVSVVQSGEINQRCKRTLSFDIQYFPDNPAQMNQAAYEMAEVLFWDMEYLELEGAKAKAKEMHCESAEGVLHFYLSYDIRLRKENETGPQMESLEQEGAIKNG